VARLAGLPRRRLLAPEVVQTSAMDCGPASLKCLLEGFGVPVSYGRLREACQTDVDGTSIDVLEEVAQKLGLDAEQVMLPIDHLLLPSTDALPALIVWRNPDGAPHFVVVWRQAFGRVMVMDPGSGRRWMRAEELLDNLYVHSMPIPADAWRSWAESDEFQGGLDLRLRRLGARDQAQPLLARCLEDATWRSFAALDGAVRMIDVLVRGKSLEPGRPAGALEGRLEERALADLASPETAGTTVPFEYWIASPAPPSAEGEEQVRLTGAVLVKVRGTRGSARAEAGEGEGEPEEALSPELEAALREPPAAPARELWRMLREDGILTPIAILGALVIAALGGAIEAILMRGMLDVGRQLGPVTQRLTAVLLVATLFAVLLALELPITGGMLRMGRRLETRLRVAFLSKIPRLSDRYFHSRPTSDMAHRCHAIHPLRQLPQMGGRLVRSVMDLLVTTTGLVWIDPRSWPIVLAAVVVSIALPWGAQSMIVERDLRVRSFDGSLTRFYLDALLGLFAVRTHGAERAVRTEHSGMLVDWARAAHDRLRASVVVEAAEQIVGFGLAVWLTFAYLARTPEPAAVLLLLYWALNVPVLGQEIAGTARSYPSIRNLMLRLLEPLGALEETDERGPDDALDETTGTFRSASASARGAHHPRGGRPGDPAGPARGGGGAVGGGEVEPRRHPAGMAQARRGTRRRRPRAPPRRAAAQAARRVGVGRPRRAALEPEHAREPRVREHRRRGGAGIRGSRRRGRQGRHARREGPRGRRPHRPPGAPAGGPPDGARRGGRARVGGRGSARSPGARDDAPREPPRDPRRAVPRPRSRAPRRAPRPRARSLARRNDAVRDPRRR
jgi:hypothetical protein